MDSWQMEDIPISKFKVVAESNTVNGEIKIITNIAGKVQEQFMQTYNEEVGAALQDLGWFPPGHICRACGFKI